MSAEISDDTEQKLIEEEYKVWKKNTPFLYDNITTSALEWPSLTVQWLPDHRAASSSKECSTHKLLLGTQSDGNDPNFLLIAEALLPSPNRPIDSKLYDEERGEVGGYAGTLSKFEVKVKIVHDGEIHRARYMPQNPFIIATKSSNPTVHVFDYSKHGSFPTDLTCRPQHRCHGHTAEGYGISWNPIEAGHLLSASADHTICLWNTSVPEVDISPLLVFKGHSKGVEDIDWNKHQPTIFASVGDDSSLLLWDCRQGSASVLKTVTNAHSYGTSGSSSSGSSSSSTGPSQQGCDVNCVSFNPFDEFTLATGGSDGSVKIWDTRNLSEAMHQCIGHKAGVYQLSWAPFRANLLASSGEDRRVYIWDLDRVGQEQTPEEAAEGPPELLFIHGGHTAKVFDFSWNANEDWFLASVAEDNVIHVWQVAESIYTEYQEDEMFDDELEDEEEEKKSKRRKK